MLNLVSGIEEIETLPTTTTPGDRMSSKFKPTLSDEERAAARALRLALQNFTALRPTMPLQYVMTFLLVAEMEGKGVQEYADINGVSQTVMTRHLLDIGERNRAREEGFGLITQERDPLDLRRHHARVTVKGKGIMHRIMQALKTAPH